MISHDPLQLERELVGTMFAAVNHDKSESISDIASWFRPEFITDEFLRGIYVGLLGVSEQSGSATVGSIVDAIVDSPQWKSTPNAMDEVSRLIFEYPVQWWHLKFFASKVHDQWRRSSASVGAASASRTLESPGADTDGVLTDLSGFSARYAPLSRDRVKSNSDVFVELLDEIENPHTVAADSVDFGLTDVDEVLGGLRPGTLTYIGARTSQGKTTLCGHTSAHAATEGKRVLFFSLEMTAKEVIRRWAHWQANKAQPAPSDLVRAMGVLDSSTFQIFAGSANIGQIESQAKAYVRHSGPSLIVVDYLQLVRTDIRTDSREQQVADVSRRLKMLAVETDSPVLVACQLSREASKADKPRLHHMRESGSIEQDADVVILLDAEDTPGETANVNIDIAKNRNGRLESVGCIWHKARFRYSNAAADHFTDDAFKTFNSDKQQGAM